MSDTSLCLKPINDLLEKHFFIPSYQRGYRWSPREVTNLLDDISAFQRNSDTKGKEAFYCLQPVVVMKRSQGDWELIDGQQRLTTIFLILTFLKPLLTIFRKTRFRLSYETREGSGTFLENLDLSRMNENIDYYHICTAYQTIEQWFELKNGTQQVSFLECLLKSNEEGKNVKIIWYELYHDNPVDVFIRLNMGKIPLTNAELIRALFLRSRNFATADVTLRQLQIAQEWDGIEKVLQYDDFWYFMHKGDVSYPARIEYLFWLITHESEPLDLNCDDPHYTFIAYSRLFTKAHSDVGAEWLKVKRHFMTCEEWFNDRTLYHLVGYLIAEGIPILDLTQAAKESGTKREFRQVLKNKIMKRLLGTPFASEAELRIAVQAKLIDLNYEDNKDAVRSVLLLFNIATLLQNNASNLRFPFASYRKEKWDIEHIRSVKSEKPFRVDAQKQWLENVVEYWTGNNDRAAQRPDECEQPVICKETIGLLDAATFNIATFDALYDKILTCFDECGSSETDNGLANLALLDAGTNRSYKNAVFPIKRRRILALDKSGTFVPLCTTNAFLKYYSHKIDNMMFWSEDDRDDYFNAIIDTLVAFFAPESGGMK